MSKLLKSIVLGMILGLIVLGQNGCALVVVGAAAGGAAAGVAYATGDLETTLEAPPQAVADATELAFKDMEMSVAWKEPGASRTKITGHSSGGVKMTVVIKGETDKFSRVSIRTGTFGNDHTQMQILERIRANLGLEPAPTTDKPADFAQTT